MAFLIRKLMKWIDNTEFDIIKLDTFKVKAEDEVKLKLVERHMDADESGT